MAILVLIADDHAVFRRWLKASLELADFRVVGEAADGLEAVRLAGELRPDVALFDLVMPGMNGVEAARAVARASPSTKTILLTAHDETPYALEAFRAGVKGYIVKSHILKGNAADQLIAGIRQVMAGTVYYSPPICCRLLEALGRKAGPL